MYKLERGPYSNIAYHNDMSAIDKLKNKIIGASTYNFISAILYEDQFIWDFPYVINHIESLEAIITIDIQRHV